MHGLVNFAIEGFVRGTYGGALWDSVRQRARIRDSHFEPLLNYDDRITEALIGAICDELRKPRDTVLEDIGSALISGATSGVPRRLLRFAGPEFLDFLYSLDDLPGRVTLAVPDLHLPAMQLIELGPLHYAVRCDPDIPGFAHVLRGVLRAMADEYGVLALLDDIAEPDGEGVDIYLVETAYATARAFSLSGAT